MDPYLNGYEVWPDADDECIAREDDWYENGPYGPGPDPVMHDCRPYGWGIELWEDEGRCAAARGTSGCFLPGLLRERDRRAYMDASTTASRRRARAADLVWDRICFRTASTHTEAVALYTRWAVRTITRRYRDSLVDPSEGR